MTTPGPVWRKATASGNHSCVEVARHPDGHILIRSSRMPAGPKLRFTPAEWDAFCVGVYRGEFDLDTLDKTRPARTP